MVTKNGWEEGCEAPGPALRASQPESSSLTTNILLMGRGFLLLNVEWPLRPPVPTQPPLLFWVFVLKGLVGLHRTIQLQLLQRYWLGHCWEPPREIPPMTKVMRREPDSKGGSGLKGPPGSSRASTPKPESVCLTLLCLSPTLLTLTGGYPRPPFSGKSQLRALVNKSPGHERNISILTPLLAF